MKDDKLRALDRVLRERDRLAGEVEKLREALQITTQERDQQERFKWEANKALDEARTVKAEHALAASRAREERLKKALERLLDRGNNADREHALAALAEARDAGRKTDE